MRVTLGGAEVDLLHEDEVLSELSHHVAHGGTPLAVTFGTLDHLHFFGVDSGRAGVFDPRPGGPDWRVLLASPLAVRTARRLTGVFWESFSPTGTMTEMLRTAARQRSRVGIVGGTREHQRVVATALADRHPELTLVGGWTPARDEIDDPAAGEALAQEVAAAKPDLLVVALGKPRQELWIDHHAAATGAGVVVGFGSANDLLDVLGVPRTPAPGGDEARRLLHDPADFLRRRLLRTPATLVRLLTQSPTEQLAEAGRHAGPVPLLATPARWRARLGKLLAGADAIGIGLASFLAYAIRQELSGIGGFEPFQDEVPIALAVLPLWLLITWGVGAYRPQQLNSGGNGLRRFVVASVAGTVLLGFLSFLFVLQLSRVYVAVLFLLVLGFGTATRLSARAYLERQRQRGRFVQNVLVAGADEEALEVADAMRRATSAGYRVVGFVDDDTPVGETVAGGLRILGRTEEALDLAYDHRAGLVVVSPTGVRPGTLRELTVALEGSPVDLAVAPSLFQVVSRRVAVEPLDTVPIFHVDQIRLQGFRGALKRTLDVVGSLVLLALLSPVAVIAAVAIVAHDGRPALFRQERAGRDGVPFTLYKFRTMVRDAEERLPEVVDLNEAGHHFFKVREDPRVTRVGRVLRKWSVDEVPQLWNVLRGDMSLVGPRPPLPREVEKYEPWHLRRLRVRPGLTGVWQVSGRSNVPFDEAVRMDLFYIENWSLLWDLALLGRTVGAVLGRTGAY